MIVIGLINYNLSKNVYYLLESIRKQCKFEYQIKLAEMSDVDPIYTHISDVKKLYPKINTKGFVGHEIYNHGIQMLIDDSKGDDLIIIDSPCMINDNIDIRELIDTSKQTVNTYLYSNIYYLNCRFDLQIKDFDKDVNYCFDDNKIDDEKYVIRYDFKEEFKDWLYEHAECWKTEYYDVIVSLTTWRGRMFDKSTYDVFDSLINQNCKYNYKVVLVLSEEEFDHIIPKEFEHYISDEFEILWTHKNTRPLKKLDPTMEKYNNIPIITLDDDDLCEPDCIEKMYEYHMEDPWFVIGTMVEQVISYCKWVAGVRLFPPKCLYNFPLNDYYTYYDGILDDNFNAMRCMYNMTPVKGVKAHNCKHNDTDIKLTNEYISTPWNEYYRRFILAHLNELPEEIYWV